MPTSGGKIRILHSSLTPFSEGLVGGVGLVDVHCIGCAFSGVSVDPAITLVSMSVAPRIPGHYSRAQSAKKGIALKYRYKRRETPKAVNWIVYPFEI